MCFLREVFDELVRDYVWSRYFAGWGSVYCSVVVAFVIYLSRDSSERGFVCASGGAMVKLSRFWGYVHGASGRCSGVAIFFRVRSVW
jgi:hypothetical protein